MEFYNFLQVPMIYVPLPLRLEVEGDCKILPGRRARHSEAVSTSDQMYQLGFTSRLRRPFVNKVLSRL